MDDVNTVTKCAKRKMMYPIGIQKFCRKDKIKANYENNSKTDNVNKIQRVLRKLKF